MNPGDSRQIAGSSTRSEMLGKFHDGALGGILFRAFSSVLQDDQEIQGLAITSSADPLATVTALILERVRVVPGLGASAK